MRYVSGSMSMNTGVAPVNRIELTVALPVWLTVTTSSPGPMPSPARMHIRATVPLTTATAWRTPTYSAQRDSISATRRPGWVEPDRSTSATAADSSGPTSGRTAGITCALARRADGSITVPPVPVQVGSGEPASGVTLAEPRV